MGFIHYRTLHSFLPTSDYPHPTAPSLPLLCGRSTVWLLTVGLLRFCRLCDFCENARLAISSDQPPSLIKRGLKSARMRTFKNLKMPCCFSSRREPKTQNACCFHERSCTSSSHLRNATCCECRRKLGILRWIHSFQTLFTHVPRHSLVHRCGKDPSSREPFHSATLPHKITETSLNNALDCSIIKSPC